MKQYYISYYLGDFYHCYTQRADTEVGAIEIAMARIPETSKAIFHDFKIVRREDYLP